MEETSLQLMHAALGKTRLLLLFSTVCVEPDWLFMQIIIMFYYTRSTLISTAVFTSGCKLCVEEMCSGICDVYIHVIVQSQCRYVCSYDCE